MTSDSERTALTDVLAGQRRHLLGALEGLSEDDLRRPVLPSGWSALGLVQHLALDVERFWFRAVIAGETVDLPEGTQGWQVPPGTSVEEVLGLYRDETARADAVIAGRDLASGPDFWSPDFFGEMPAMNLRETLLHVITETACHAGHLDVVRELIDGKQWLVLT